MDLDKFKQMTGNEIPSRPAEAMFYTIGKVIPSAETGMGQRYLTGLKVYYFARSKRHIGKREDFPLKENSPASIALEFDAMYRRNLGLFRALEEEVLEQIVREAEVSRAEGARSVYAQMQLELAVKTSVLAYRAPNPNLPAQPQPVVTPMAQAAC